MIELDPAIYAHNREAIAKARPELLCHLDESGAPPLNVFVDPKGARDFYIHQNKAPHDTNVEAYYGNDAANTVATTLATQDWRTARLAVLLGIGLGHELSMLLGLMPNQTSLDSMWIVEHDPQVFRLALKHTDLRPWLLDAAHHFFIGLPLPALYREFYHSALRTESLRALRCLELIVPPGALAMAPEYYTEAAKTFRHAATQAVTDVGNDPEDTLLGVEHLLSNLDVILEEPDLAVLRQRFAHKMAIVVAAGPSLRKQLPTLARIQNELLLVAADTALKPLLEAGVQPHIVVSRERTERTIQLFRGLDAKNTVLAGLPVIPPTCFQEHPGPKLPLFASKGGVGQGEGLFDWLKLERSILQFGGSVGNMAFKLCEYLGADPIVLVGQDLAFGSDGATHTQGAALGTHRSYFAEQTSLEVPGNLGEPVRTTPVWLEFLRRYEFDLTTYRGQCRNATEGGAYIQGTVVMPLEVALQDLQAFDPRPQLQHALVKPSRKQIGREAKQLRTEFEATRQFAKQLIALCQEGVTEVKAALAAPPDAKVMASLSLESSRRIEAAFGLPPFASLYHRRIQIVAGVDAQRFQRFVKPIVEAEMVHLEMEIYGLERGTSQPLVVYQNLLNLFGRWFENISALTERASALLLSGDKALQKFTE